MSEAVQARALMRSIIGRIATGPELSKDISREEACAGMRAVLEGAVDPVQAGIFLIALRMKRETDEENCGVLDAVREATRRVTAPVDEVVDLADPYDGMNRNLPAAPFTPALLAACGVPAFSHGVERMGPKYGVTHRQVLHAAGLKVDATPEEAAARLGDPRAGWAYLDQSVFCPKLNALTDLRTLIVKRPVITTVEVLAQPLVGRRKTHLVTGYVHKPYPRVYALLAREAGYDTALLVRGVEGGVVPALAQGGKVFRSVGRGEPFAVEFRPAELGIEQTLRAPQIPPALAGEGEGAQAKIDANAVAKVAAQAGLDALAGERGPTRDALVYGAALVLWHLGKSRSLREAAEVARTAIDDGSALARLRAQG